MNEYIATARKWRPMKFDEVIGQGHVIATLRNALAMNHLAHAYLFSGPRGVGKTTAARLLAKAVNCLHPVATDPDNVCEICAEITDGRSFDVLEIDGASNRGVEEIRNLRESVRYPPAKGKYKVYIIDEVHMLTKEAFNALLKTLEEPPSHVLFIFATTELHKVPATIVSRCQRFAFRRIAIAEIIGNLRAIAGEEGVNIDDDALLLIAKKADGSLRDAQSIFDQIVALCGRSVTYGQITEALNTVDEEVFFRVTDLIKTKDIKGGLALVEEMMSSGHDIKEFIVGLLEHLRNIMIAKATGSTSLIEASDLYRKRYAEEAAQFSVVDLLRLQRLVTGTETATRWSAQPRFKLEADIVQMISMHSAADVAELVQRIDELKATLGVQGTEPVSPSSRPTSASIARAVPTDSSLQPSTDQPARSDRSMPRRQAQPRRSDLTEEQNRSMGGNTVEELSARWGEVVSEVRKQRISLGSVLDSTRLISLQGGVLRLGCASEFEASSIKRQRDFLADTIYRLLSITARVEVEIRTNLGEPPPSSHENGPAGTPGQEDEHPVIKAMRKELGAEPL